MSFKINLYNSRVANKVIDGKQCTILWYVDDNKIFHMNPKVVDHMIKQIEDKFGKITITRGKYHVFVGMDIKFLENGKVQIFMKDYITESIECLRVSVRKQQRMLTDLLKIICLTRM